MRMLDCAAVFVSLVLLLSAYWIADHQYPLRRGEPISEARALLLKDGWIPVRIDKKMADGRRENTYGDARPFFEAGYFEVETCTGIGRNYCFLNYQKDGKCLRLMTEGEYVPRRVEPDLLRWTEECPE